MCGGAINRHLVGYRLHWALAMLWRTRLRLISSPVAPDGYSGTLTLPPLLPPTLLRRTTGVPPSKHDSPASKPRSQRSKPAKRRAPSMGIRESVAACEASTRVSPGRIPATNQGIRMGDRKGGAEPNRFKFQGLIPRTKGWSYPTSVSTLSELKRHIVSLFCWRGKSIGG